MERETEACSSTTNNTTNPPSAYKAEFDLLLFARTNDIKGFEELISNHPSLDINFRGLERKNLSWSALHLASYFGHVNFVEKLLDVSGINIDIQNDNGDTPLHKAALTNRVAIVQKLLVSGANVFKSNLSGYSPRLLTTNGHIIGMINAAEKVDKRSQEEPLVPNRFEGPLQRKARLLGFRRTYVVVENGALLLFNNQQDFLKRSLKAYKYLENAKCEPVDENQGSFMIEFADSSKVIFMIDQRDIEYYNIYTPNQTLKNQVVEDRKSNIVIELIKIRWMQAINEHVRYCAQFGKNSCRTKNSTHETNCNNNQIISSNKTSTTVVASAESAIQEASAHFSILNKHANSLCKLLENDNKNHQNILQDWHYIQFHLNLLVESAKNARESFGNALYLMEDQVKAKIELEQRCRALEDSLHSINHHELEKSRSMSMLHLKSCTSVSTGLNSFYDAFEDFEDERTLTPESINLSDKEDMNTSDEKNCKPSTSSLYKNSNTLSSPIANSHYHHYNDGYQSDDTHSNCSVLTVGNGDET